MKKLLVTLWLMLFSFASFCQVKGKITDEKNQPVAQASITAKIGSRMYKTISDSSGFFCWIKFLTEQLLH